MPSLLQHPLLTPPYMLSVVRCVCVCVNQAAEMNGFMNVAGMKVERQRQEGRGDRKYCRSVTASSAPPGCGQ